MKLKKLDYQNNISLVLWTTLSQVAFTRQVKEKPLGILYLVTHKKLLVTEYTYLSI